MLSWAWVLFELRLTIIFSILSAVKLIVRNILSVTYLGFMGSLFNKEHWLEKKELKISALSLEPAIKKFSWNNDCISGVFLLFKKIYNKE